MTALLSVLLLALLTAPRLLRNRPRWRTPVRLALCAAALALSALRFAETRTPATPYSTAREVFDRHHAVGWKLGSLLAADVAPGARVLVLQSPNRSPGWIEITASQRKGLEAATASRALRLECYLADPGFVLHAEAEDVRIRPMSECLGLAAEADAVVSFVPLPLEQHPLDALPPVYLVDALGAGYWRDALRAGCVRVVVTPKMQVGAPRGPASGEEDPAARFAALYDVITIDTLDHFKTPIEQFKAHASP